MDTKEIYKIINMYPFVKTEVERFSTELLEQRLWEYGLMKKQRTAVTFCKTVNGINHGDSSKLTNEEKVYIENCVRKNF